MKKIYLLIPLLLCVISSWGAEISEVTHQQVGNNIEISYKINQTQKNQLFDVSVYCSINGIDQADPLVQISGDAGENILGGGKKTIIWDVIKEYGNLNGEVKFKIVAVPSKILEATTTKVAGVNISVKKCTQADNIVELVVQLKNGSSVARFDLYTNYIKAVTNNGQELYAIDYVNGMDKVTTKRPIMIGANQTKELTIHFEASEKYTYLSLLEIETKFPNDFGIIQNIVID